jgi:hypothetical protein
MGVNDFINMLSDPLLINIFMKNNPVVQVLTLIGQLIYSYDDFTDISQ